jgi:transglutaminase-like putative cysteine protease
MTALAQTPAEGTHPMRIAISHTTRYQFDAPVRYGVQRLRLRPRDCAVQTVVEWAMTVEGAVIETAYDDHNGNNTTLITVGQGVSEVVITAHALVDVRDTHGVVGPHAGFMPLWLFAKETPLTKAGPLVRALAGRFKLEGAGDIEVLHELSAAVKEAVVYEKDVTDATTTAEQALELGKGVCQDHAHVFIAAARVLGLPARYVSGYLLLDEGTAQDAGHAWAEAHVPGLGWVGFDPSNEICPDARYVRVAVGADYAEAAPVTSLTQGAGASGMSVALDVAQHLMAQ